MKKDKLSLDKTHPELLELWDYEKNGALTPDKVTHGSRLEVFWICPKGSDHQWKEQIRTRSQTGYSCPFCLNRRASITNSLAALYPDLAAQFDLEGNNGLTPDKVVAGSSKKYIWVCAKNPEHRWKATAHNRVIGRGCPFCTHKKIEKATSLAALAPHLLEEWDYKANEPLTPDKIFASTHKKVHWICKKNPKHKWKANVNNRKKGRGCPFCANIFVDETNSLATLMPFLLTQWDYAKNNEKNIYPDKVTAESNLKVSWICSVGPDHKWEAQISSRTHGRGCPYCAGKLVSVTNSLAALFPDVAKELLPEDNKGITADNLTAHSDKKIVWTCKNNPAHKWEVSVTSRTSKGTIKNPFRNCPFCMHNKVSPETSLATKYPNVAKEFHPTYNAPLTPEMILPGYSQRVWWQCQINLEHVWFVSPADRINQTTGYISGCTKCKGGSKSKRKYSVESTDLEEKAKLNSEELRQYVIDHWDYEKNTELNPTSVALGSERKVFWKCKKGPDHEWEAGIYNQLKGRNCPCCSNLKLSVTNSLATIAPTLTDDWDYEKNKPLTPSTVVAFSTKKVFWKCRKNSDHTWATSPNKRVIRGDGCPFCGNRRLSPTVNSLAAVAPSLIPQWDFEQNKGLSPTDVIAESPIKVHWVCSLGSDHKWKASVNSRVYGVGCPFCAGKRVSVTNSLATLYPELAAELLPEDNNGITASDVVSHSQKKLVWSCSSNPNHKWPAIVSSRTGPNKNGCPYCGHKIVSPETSLAATYPSVAKEFDLELNAPLTPEMLLPGSGVAVWWRCQTNPEHIWRTTPNARINVTTGQTKGCSMCIRGFQSNRVRSKQRTRRKGKFST